MIRTQAIVLKFLSAFFLLTIFSTVALAQPMTQTNRPGVNINPNLNGLIEALPEGYNTPGTTYPLIIFFMGINSTGPGTNASLENLFGQGGGFIHDQIRAGEFPTSFTVNGNTFKFIVLTPQFVTNFNTRRPTPQEVNDLINYAIANYKVDTTRIYLMGNSGGGQLPWDYIANSSAYANRIAAIIPFAGTSFPSEEKANKGKYSGVAVWAFHNLQDPVVPVQLTTEYIKMMRALPSPAPADKVKGTHFNSNSHNTTFQPLTRAYTENGLNIYQWMLQYSRTVSKANAGNDKDITLPVSSTTLDGSGTGPNGTTTARNWVQLSGPTSATFSSNTVPTPTVSNLVEGTYIFRYGITDNSFNTATDDITVRVYPQRIEAENFLPSSNTPYVTIHPSTDVDGGSTVNDVYGGNWLDYTVNVPAAGDYILRYRLSSWYGGVQFQVIDVTGGANNLLKTKDVYWTESWDIYITQTDTVTLPAGARTLRIQNSAANPWNFNWMQLMAIPNLAPLPVNFSLFNANCVNNKVSLLWKTSGETDSRNFVVERSNDGRNWQAITSIPSSGQSTGEKTYTYTDASATSASMYRIAETGLNGRITYSSIIKGNCAGNKLFSVFPNPVKSHTMIDISVDQKSKLNISLVDVRGAVVLQQEVSVLKGTNQVEVNMSNLPKGTYTLMAQWDNEIRSAKVIKN